MEKTAIITGASRGIGAQMAILFAEKGYNVVVNYNESSESAKILTTSLRSRGHSVVSFKADVRNRLETDLLVKETIYKLSSKIQKQLADYVDKKVTLGIRPEDVHIAKDNESKFDVNIDYSELLGYDLMLYFFVGNNKVVAKVGEQEVGASESKISVHFDETKLHFFDTETERSI